MKKINHELIPEDILDHYTTVRQPVPCHTCQGEGKIEVDVAVKS